jgi:5-methylcytosine-specific restriction protein A
MNLRDVLQKIGNEYENAIPQGFAHHSLAQFIRSTAVEVLASFPGVAKWTTQGSPGKGVWADVPWLAYLDSSVTSSVMTGQYVVYLFAPSRREIYLSLNQGTTDLVHNYGEKVGRSMLKQRATLMRTFAEGKNEIFPDFDIQLGSNNLRGNRYQIGHALGYKYLVDNLPSEDQLQIDLKKVLDIYADVVFHLGMDDEIEAEVPQVFQDVNKEKDKSEKDVNTIVLEKKKYKMHFRIERQGNLGKRVKKRQGLRCKACGIDYGEKYGKIGQSCVDAHHLTPLSTLEADTEISSDIDKDFAVLCANCHRMIHRMSDPSNIKALRDILSRTGN